MNLSTQDLAEIKTLLGRDATDVELRIFDTMWSEHCSYKSSKRILKQYLPTQGSEVALGIGEDAGIIRWAEHNGHSYCIAISHESHNHPSQVLPIEGAATGVGGVVRDVYCMGADVIGVMNSLHFGIDPDSTLVEDIAQNVVVGVADYANPLGVPVMGGETLYHESYNDNCLVNVAAVGLVREDQIIRSKVPELAKTEPFDVILLGKSTDATGFGGASFSSATLDKENDTQNLGAVQVHDPFLKRVIVEAIKALQTEIYAQNIPTGFKDLGAGGIACATSELAAAAGLGVEVNLDAVNVAQEGLNPEVIACSETQERFCLIVPASFSQTVLKIFNEDFALPQLYPAAGAAIIGRIVTEPTYRVRYRGQVVCELPIGAITTEVKADRKAQPRPIHTQSDSVPTPTLQDLQTHALDMMSLPNVISKRYVYRYFDHCVQGKSVMMPGEADAGLVAPLWDSFAALATSMDSNLYGNVDPYVSGAAAVAESVRNVISVGARPIAITDCLNYGNPENPSSFYDFEKGVQGIGDAAKALGFISGEALPVISGNVSFYNDSKQGTAVVPSPVIVALGQMQDYRKALSMKVNQAGLTLILVGKRYAEMGATQWAQLQSEAYLCAPQVRFEEEAKQNKVVYALIQSGQLQACHDISGGGLWVSIVEMLLGERGSGDVGAHLTLLVHPVVELFSENGGYVLAVSEDQTLSVLDQLAAAGVFSQVVGYTMAGGLVRVESAVGEFEVRLSDLAAGRESRNLVLGAI